MKSKLPALFAAILLSACGGADSAQCSLPSEIVIARSAGQPIGQWRKATPSSGYVQVASGNSAANAVLSCPVSGSNQLLSYSVTAENFFNGGANSQGAHATVLTRASINLSIPWYVGRGPIYDAIYGVMAERHYLDYPGNPGRNILQCPPYINGGSCPNDGSGPYMTQVHPITMQDNVVYNTSLNSTLMSLDYSIGKTSTGQVASSTWAENYDFTYLTGNQIAFSAVCRNGCPQPFIVRFFNISGGWQ